MPTFFTLRFESLCAFVQRDNTSPTEVYLLADDNMTPPEKRHTPMLTIPSVFLDLSNTTWTPTQIGLFPTGDLGGGMTGPVQVAQWALKDEEVTIADTDVSSTQGPPDFSNKTGVLQFRNVNPGCTTRAKADIKRDNAGVCVVMLSGTRSTLKSDDLQAFSIKKNGIEILRGSFGNYMVWTPIGSAVIVNKSNERISFTNPPVSATITNVAPVNHAEGLAHFHHYYVGLTLAASDGEATIDDHLANVFDCVPPTEYP